MEQIVSLILQLKNEIQELRLGFQSTSQPPLISEKWVPLSVAAAWLKYKPTQMAELLKTGQLTVSKIGKRKFILRDSIIRLLDSSIINS